MRMMTRSRWRSPFQISTTSNSRWSASVTVILELPATTWRFVATSPSLLTTKPVPRDWSVRTETTEGVERAAISAGVRIVGAGATFCWLGASGP